MNINEKAEFAANLKLSGKANCCQAVLLALKEETGLDDDQLMSLGAGFCAGMGNLSATCGSLVGAVMALGLKTKGEGSLRLARLVNEEFQNTSGAIKCKDLKTITNGKPLCPCDDCVRNAIKAYGNIVNNK